MEQLEISNVAKETVCILNYFNPTFISKIPDNVLNKLKELAKESKIIVNVDINKNLEEQEISEKTKDLIAYIYYSYIATEEQKKNLMEIWNKNELLYQEEIRQKYNPDNIFSKNTLKEQNKLSIVETKKTMYNKILEKIKEILKF